MVLLTTKHMQSPGLKIEILRDRLLLRKKVLFNMDRKDVYKRQGLSRRPCRYTESAHRTFCRRRRPVSYTHLDVYKRQQHNIYFIKCQVIFVSILYMTSLSVSYTHLNSAAP